MDEEEFLDIQADIWEIFEGDTFPAKYRVLDTSESIIDTDFGIEKYVDEVEYDLRATYTLPHKLKRFDRDTAEFVPTEGGKVYFSTYQVEQLLNLTIQPQLGLFILNGLEYEIHSVHPLPHLFNTSIVIKCLVKPRSPHEGTQ